MKNQKLAVRVDESDIGKGVFATEFILADESVGRIKGVVHNDPDYSSDYCIDMGDSYSLEPHAPFRFLNHSCEPNCQILQWEDFYTTPSPLQVHAIRHIRPGEQLTIDYAWSSDGAIRCMCGSERCRGWIVAPENVDELPPQPL